MGADDQSGSTASETERVARGYFDAVARRDVEAMASFWEPGSLDVIHGVVEMRVPDDMRSWFGTLFAAFPDYRFEVLDVMANDEKAAVHWRATGSFEGHGRFQGLIPNGGKVDVQGCDVLRVHNGLIVANDAFLNGAEMARQLGILPPEGSLPERAMNGALNLKTRLAARLNR